MAILQINSLTKKAEVPMDASETSSVYGGAFYDLFNGSIGADGKAKYLLPNGNIWTGGSNIANSRFIKYPLFDSVYYIGGKSLAED